MSDLRNQSGLVHLPPRARPRLCFCLGFNYGSLITTHMYFFKAIFRAYSRITQRIYVSQLNNSLPQLKILPGDYEIGIGNRDPPHLISDSTV